jgi:hypothetical protein
MNSTAGILGSKNRLFQGISYTPCRCFVLNLFLGDRGKAFQGTTTLIPQGKFVITVFGDRATRKMFQRCAVQESINSCSR